jgi:hypothetical protein
MSDSIVTQQIVGAVSKTSIMSISAVAALFEESVGRGF